MNPVRVLVVDDSAFARKALREVLRASDDIEVVGTARDGLDALEQIEARRPDVVTLDLMMPGLDGLGVLEALAGKEAPRVVLVSIAAEDSDQAVEGLRLGAVGLVRKPTALATDRLYELGEPLREAVLAAALARPQRVAPQPRLTLQTWQDRLDLVAVGTSTGGPVALSRLLAALPGDLPVPVAVVQHIPADYVAPLARRIDAESAVTVRMAEEGMAFSAGEVLIAPGDFHLRVVRRGNGLFVGLDPEPAQVAHRPSVDVLFESVAQAAGARGLGVVLTGMGDDGLAGSRALVAAGAEVLAEAASSCVVYGMSRRVVEAGLASAEAPLQDLGALILDRL